MFDLKQHAINQRLDVVAENKFDRMVEVLTPGEQGVAKIDHFEMGPDDVRASIEIQAEEYVPMGRYARLRVNGQLMMSDSPMEKRTNLEVIDKAKGRVLIAGLGLGMILRTLLRKPEVTHITVLEKYRDVIDLVFPSLLELVAQSKDFPPRLEVLCEDVFQWEPPPNLPRFHTIYFDIWPNAYVENLPEMRLLHKRYRPLLVKGGWMSSWTYDKMVEKERNDRKFLRSDLPKKLWHTLQTEGGGKLANAAIKMLIAPEEKIDLETKDAIVHWLRDHRIALELKISGNGNLAPGQEAVLRERLTRYGVGIVE